MGEGSRDRSSKRHKSLFRSTQKSSSDSEIAHRKLRERKVKFRDELPWPKTIEVLTVDELARYRRRRILNHPKPTLDAGFGYHDDTFERLVSEYRRAFRVTSENSMVQKNDTIDSLLDSNTLDKVKTHVASMGTDAGITKISSQVSNESPLARSGKSLKCGGEFYGDTEYSNYGRYEGIHRPELARRPTSLRMEGDMRTVTEQCEKFIEWLNVSRPGLARVPTHLKLEGQQETSTENHDKYVPFVGVRRPDILRQSAHLKLEGETTFLPEYTDVFRQPMPQEKRSLMLPESHLKAGGEFSERTEHSQQFSDPRGSVLISNNPYSKMNVDLENSEHVEEILDEKLQNGEEDMNMLLSKLEDLKGPPLETPEYKDAYRNFPRERPKLMKPEDEIGRADGSKIRKSSNKERFHMKINQDPEYQSKFLDKEPQVYRKIPMSSRGAIGSSNFNKHLVADLRSQGSTSEVKSQYVPYRNIPRVESCRMPQNLQPEGHMDLLPEYRSANCGRDPQPSDSRYPMRRNRENNWINNNNSQAFGMINAQHDQDAFQLVQTRVHENTISGKPPIVARKTPGLSQIHRPTNVDVTSTSLNLRHQSPSPTYRLHVHDVDNKSRDLIQSSQRKAQTSPSPEEMTSGVKYRSYEPSFGRESQQNYDRHAFVVLNSPNAPTEPQRRRHLDGNSNFEELDSNTRTQKKTPSNWMPPWYDNTTAI